MADHSKKVESHAQFKKLQRAEDGKKAMSEYESQGAALRANAERLKALRLARDATEQAAANTGFVYEEKPARKKKAAAAPLSEWLKAREGGGRNN